MSRSPIRTCIEKPLFTPQTATEEIRTRFQMIFPNVPDPVSLLVSVTRAFTVGHVTDVAQAPGLTHRPLRLHFTPFDVHRNHRNKKAFGSHLGYLGQYSLSLFGLAHCCHRATPVSP